MPLCIYSKNMEICLHVPTVATWVGYCRYVDRNHTVLRNRLWLIKIVKIKKEKEKEKETMDKNIFRSKVKCFRLQKSSTCE